MAELLFALQVPARKAIPFRKEAWLTATTPPVPTASTKQEHNQYDNQNRF